MRRVEIAKEVIAKTFGASDDGQFPYLTDLAEKCVKYYDEAIGDEYGNPHDEMANFLWMNFSGGGTCYGAADRIEAAWKEEGLV